MDANIVVSHGLRRWLQVERGLRFSDDAATYGTTVIYNGADPDRLEPTGTSIKQELGLPTETRLLGMVGNFYRDARKDQMTVCRALTDIFERVGNVHCVFAGGVETGAEDKLAACRLICQDAGITDRVHFLGSRADVPDILSELDIFIFSSLQEGLPVAVSEAMLAGVAMVVSDIEPLLEATNGGEVAEVFRVGDDKELAVKLDILLSDDGRRQQLAKAAKQFANDNFSIDSHLTALTQLYESVRR